MATITQLSDTAIQFLRAKHGVVTFAELRALGLGRKAIDRLCTLGVLRRVTRGVLVLTTAEPSLEHRCRLLCCLHPSGFVTGPTAGALAHVRRMPTTAAIHFSVRHGVHLHHVDGVVFRQTTKLGDDDVRVRRDGIVVASWKRLAFDLAADLTPLDHRSALHQMMDDQRVTADELLAAGRRLCHPGRRGSTTFELSLLELGRTPQDSHPEVILADVLLRRGVPVEPQVAVKRIDGITVHLDLGVPAAQWGVELDIHPEHRSVDGHQRATRRVRSLHGTEWQIEPVSELDMTDVEHLADELAELYRRRTSTSRVPSAECTAPVHSAQS